MVPVEPRVLEVEATGGVVGRDIEERGAPAPRFATGSAENAGGGSSNATEEGG